MNIIHFKPAANHGRLFYARNICMPLIIAFIAVFVVGGVAGSLVTHWKDGAKIERLTSSNAVLSTTNDKCATDIAAVRQSITDIQDKADERAKAASISMVVATRTADTHTAKAKQIKSLPPVPVDMQCEATRLEQLKYVQERAQ